MKVSINNTDWKTNNVKNFFSKALLTLEGGAVKLVKVAAEASYPAHLHPDKTEYVYVLQGQPQFQIGTDVFDASPDEFYIFPSNTMHAISNHTSAECLLLVGNVKNISA